MHTDKVVGCITFSMRKIRLRWFVTSNSFAVRTVMRRWWGRVFNRLSEDILLNR